MRCFWAEDVSISLYDNPAFVLCFNYIKNFDRRNRAKRIIPIVTLRNLPQQRLMTTYEMCPKTMPSDMLYAKGIKMIQRNAGIASV
jgi:hypothetical protein